MTKKEQKERIDKLEDALRQIFLLSIIDGKRLSDAIRMAGQALGPERV